MNKRRTIPINRSGCAGEREVENCWGRAQRIPTTITTERTNTNYATSLSAIAVDVALPTFPLKTRKRATNRQQPPSTVPKHHEPLEACPDTPSFRDLTIMPPYNINFVHANIDRDNEQVMENEDVDETIFSRHWVRIRDARRTGLRLFDF